MIQNTIKTYRFFINCIVCIIFIFAINQAYAQTFNNTSMEGANISIIFSYEPIANDHEWLYGLIDVKLKPHWKTYWKNSGNSGLAPQLDFNEPITAELLFSAPHLLRDGKDWAYIYQDHTQIVFRIATNAIKNKAITGDLLIGVCNTICVPVTVPFMFNEKSSNNLINKLKIQTALYNLPNKEDNQFYIQSVHQQHKNIEITLHTSTPNNTAELFLNTDKAQLGVANITKTEKNKIIFLAPIISGTLKDNQKIDFIAKQNDKTIAGTVNLKH